MGSGVMSRKSEGWGEIADCWLPMVMYTMKGTCLVRKCEAITLGPRPLLIPGMNARASYGAPQTGLRRGSAEKAGLPAAAPRPVVYGRQRKYADGLFFELRDLAHTHEFERSLSLCKTTANCYLLPWTTDHGHHGPRIMRIRSVIRERTRH